jgi:hypothetical protein
MTHKTIQLIAVCVALLVAVLGLDAWLSARHQGQELKTTLAAQDELISEAKGRENQRAESLQSLVKEIVKLKAETRTPSQVLKALPQYLRLPKPITLTQSTESPLAMGQDLDPSNLQFDSDLRFLGLKKPAPGSNQVPIANESPLTPAGSSNVQLPVDDLKPLFDFVQDCRACDARLTASRKEAVDAQATLNAVTRERDAALKANRGGSFWRRIYKNAEWLAAGAVGGYIIARR